MKPDPSQNPKLSPPQVEALTTLFHRVIQIAAENTGMNRTCLSCAHFTEGVDHCAKWNRRPPARVIVESCPAWVGGEPF